MRSLRSFASLRMTIAVLLIAGACNHAVDRARWQGMSPNEKTLYVRSLIGGEKAKNAKGGNDRVFTLPPDEYVRRIDAAYQRGETRPVDVVFEEMGSVRR